MFARIATFANDAEIQSAGSTLSQLQIVYAGGAVYIDRGWQTFVNGLSAACGGSKGKDPYRENSNEYRT